jgi:lipoprotein NlpI
MNMRRAGWGLLVVFGLASMAPSAQDAPAAPADREAALAAQLPSLDKRIEANPRDTAALERRAALLAAAGRHDQALADYDRLLELEPTAADLYDERGSQHFILGHIGESIEDFDRAIKLRPDREPWHWKRGISYYYAGRYDDGRRQFEGYQTVDDNDVENAVWRFLCMARAKDVETARKDILKIKRDARVPMMEVYALYAGQAQPSDVLEAARAGSPSAEAAGARLFYAHLYLGLYYEVRGDVAKAREHIASACKHRIDHYMWNVADVHLKRLTPKTGVR